MPQRQKESAIWESVSQADEAENLNSAQDQLYIISTRPTSHLGDGKYSALAGQKEASNFQEQRYN